MRRFLPAAIGLGLLAVILLAVWLRQYQAFTQTPLEVAPGTVLQVARGATMQSVVADLAGRGVTRQDWRWQVFNRLHPVTIRAGEYALRAGMRPAELLALLASGEVIHYSFTIVEGWTFARLRDALASDAVLAQTLPGLGDAASVMAALGAEESHPEGWFLPETYRFVRGDSDLDILRRAYRAMQDALAEAWRNRADLPLKSPYELLTLASIVEKESALEAERPAIAGVFVRRLQQGWRLETDPTVIYGLGEAFDGDIRTRDLRADNPYNTYTRHGLPPTPIALPGRSALAASANPAPGTAMFFVADGRGGHHFSDTLAEHEQAVRRMLGKTP